jgi:hypothetical protein
MKDQNSKHISNTEAGSKLTHQFGAKWRRKQGLKRSSQETKEAPQVVFTPDGTKNAERSG